MSEPFKLESQDALLNRFREATLAEVRNDEADLNLRQLAVTLTVYLTDKPQTVRGLAKYLNVGGSCRVPG